jgi:hypothetical protein
MKRLAAVSIVFAAVLMTGCATGYVSSDENIIAGGFSEIRLAPETWRVLVEGNALTGRGEVEKFLMRRAAELTLEQGKRYFILEDHDAWMARRVSRSEDGTLRVSHAPRNEAVVTAIDAQERNAFDAVRIVAETEEIAEGKLSQAARKTLAGIGAS